MNGIGDRICQLKNHEYTERLQQLYVDPEQIPEQEERYIRLLNTFREQYGEQETALFSAPGRTEVGGNHTDHQFGQVLAASVNLDTIAAVSPRQDRTVRVLSEGYPPFAMDLEDLSVRREETGTTQALIRGVAAGVQRRGWEIRGFDACITSTVLPGSGLSSSAAFEVLIGNIFSGLYCGNALSAVEIAKIGQMAENEYFGKPCGLMDQMASSVGGLVHIDFGNPEEPAVTPVPVDFRSFCHDLCIVDTHGSHADLTQDYADIPAEMRRVARFFGAEYLKQVEEAEFRAKVPELRLAVGDRAVLRAFHWYRENRRVGQLVQALERRNFVEFCLRIRQSGDSSFRYLQNVYSPHNPAEQGLSLALYLSEEILDSEDGGYGVSRVHGGGFAGTIQAFVDATKTGEYRRNMDRIFGEGSCHVLQIRPVGGTRVF